MTDPPWLRPLPIRVPVADGESLHSWVEALAARYRMTVRELVPALGLRAPRTPYGLIRGIGDEALRWAWQEPRGEGFRQAGSARGPGRPAPGSARAALRRTAAAGHCPGT
jgi:hypothetical protein